MRGGDSADQYDPYCDLFVRPGSEAFAKLFDAEVYFMVPQSYVNDEEKKALRTAAVGIIQSHASSNVDDALVPYMALTYFDRFLSRNDIPNVTTTSGEINNKLFVICCLTIASKLHRKYFALSDFLKRNLEYSAPDVLEMELAICRGLEWRMRTLTPFCFAEFFIPVLRELRPNLPSPRDPVHHLIVRSQSDIAFAMFRPSVIAACTVIIVTSKLYPDRHRYVELKILMDVEPLRLLDLKDDMIVRCQTQLAQLYPSVRRAWSITNVPIHKPPSRIFDSTTGEEVIRPSAPAPIGAPPEAEEPSPAMHHPEKEPVTGETQSDEPMPMHCPGKEPVTGDIQSEEHMPMVRRPGKESVTGDIQSEEPMPIVRRPGKEPVTSHEIEELHDELLDQVWKQVMEDAERSTWKELETINEHGSKDDASSSSESPRDGTRMACAILGTCIARKVTKCCTKIATLCENVKGMRCNIM